MAFIRSTLFCFVPQQFVLVILSFSHYRLCYVEARKPFWFSNLGVTHAFLKALNILKTDETASGSLLSPSIPSDSDLTFLRADFTVIPAIHSQFQSGSRGGQSSDDLRHPSYFVQSSTCLQLSHMLDKQIRPELFPPLDRVWHILQATLCGSQSILSNSTILLG